MAKPRKRRVFPFTEGRQAYIESVGGYKPPGA